MKNRILICAWLLSIGLYSCRHLRTSQPIGITSYVPQSQLLHDTIVGLDSMLFDAYNNCKLHVFAGLISDDIEFYHDRGGLTTSKPDIVQSIKNNICNKVRREILSGSTEIHPIPGYGAVQISVHRFHNLVEKSTSRYSKAVQTWKREEDGHWRVTRIISLH